MKKQKNKTQAACVASATGCKKDYVLSCLPGHTRITESQPDACHTIKDVLQNVMNLVTGHKVDLSKIVVAEKEMNRLHILHRSSSSYNTPSLPGSSDHDEAAATVIMPKVKRTLTCGQSASHPKKSKHKHRISGCDNTKEGEQKIPDNLPFLLTKAELKIADQRAENIRVPVGFGLKPSSFISSSVKLAD